MVNVPILRQRMDLISFLYAISKESFFILFLILYSCHTVNCILVTFGKCPEAM